MSLSLYVCVRVANSDFIMEKEKITRLSSAAALLASDSSFTLSTRFVVTFAAGASVVVVASLLFLLLPLRCCCNCSADPQCTQGKPQFVHVRVCVRELFSLVYVSMCVFYLF